MFKNIEVIRLKRKDYINWNDYFMSLAILASKRSKDPNSQVGACIIDKNNKIVSLGYNGFPIGCSDDELPWERKGDPLETKYLYVCHAEINSILLADKKLDNCILYSTLAPCNECAKLIIQSGIKKVVYKDDKYHNTDMCVAARKMFELTKIKYEQYVPNIDNIIINLKE